MARRHSNSARLAPPARGFTLLEVLLAMLLSTVVLAGLWSALSIHLRMFDAGRTQVEQAQLSRALLNQIANDLRQAVVDPALLADPLAVSPSDPFLMQTTAFQPNEFSQATIPDDALPSSFWTTSNKRHYRFQGGPQQLTFDVHALPTPLLHEPLSPVAQPPRITSGLSTVQYQFLGDLLSQNTADSSTTTGEATGLMRRVTSWARLEDESELLVTADPLDLANQSGQAGATSSTSSSSSRDVYDTQTPLDLVEDLTPEVSQLQFRYYDGAEWVDYWDGSSRGGLPRAIEISLAFHLDAPDAADIRSNQNERLIAFDTLADLGIPVYRLIVQLPRGKRVEPAGDAGNSSSPATELPPNNLTPSTTDPQAMP